MKGESMTALARETVFLALVCTADLVLTAYLISTGLFTEANPILAYYLEYGLGTMCLVKLASFVVPLALAEWYRRHRPEFVRGLLRVVLCLYITGYFAGVTAINLPRLFS